MKTTKKRYIGEEVRRSEVKKVEMKCGERIEVEQGSMNTI
jgi:hypothetical protein